MSSAETYAENRASGVCNWTPGCTEPAVDGMALCQTHRLRNAENMRKKSAKQFEAGRCIRGCGRASLNGKRCEACRLRETLNRNIRLYGETGIERLAAQDGRCAICSRDIAFGAKGDRKAVIDHCHVEHRGCGCVRAVLCSPCNKTEGWARKYGNHALALERMKAFIDGHIVKCQSNNGPGHDEPVFIDDPYYSTASHGKLTGSIDCATLPNTVEGGGTE
jgi:hypothetical protein